MVGKTAPHGQRARDHDVKTLQRLFTTSLLGLFYFNSGVDQFAHVIDVVRQLFATELCFLAAAARARAVVVGHRGSDRRGKPGAAASCAKPGD